MSAEYVAKEFMGNIIAGSVGTATGGSARFIHDKLTNHSGTNTSATEAQFRPEDAAWSALYATADVVPYVATYALWAWNVTSNRLAKVNPIHLLKSSTFCTAVGIIGDTAFDYLAGPTIDASIGSGWRYAARAVAGAGIAFFAKSAADLAQADCNTCCATDEERRHLTASDSYSKVYNKLPN